jgi:hypothetical protein
VVTMSDARLIRQLYDRINLLEEQLRQLREDLVPPNNPFLHIFSYQHAALLLGIYGKHLATYSFLDAICSKTGHIGRGEGEDYARHRVKVAIYKLKKKLREHDIEVCTRRGLGYYLDDENRAKVEKLMEKKNA